jgi:hypothetical protein
MRQQSVRHSAILYGSTGMGHPVEPVSNAAMNRLLVRYLPSDILCLLCNNVTGLNSICLYPSAVLLCLYRLSNFVYNIFTKEESVAQINPQHQGKRKEGTNNLKVHEIRYRMFGT